MYNFYKRKTEISKFDIVQLKIFKENVSEVLFIFYSPIPVSLVLCQEGRGHWAVYYTSPKCLIITFSYSLV